MIVLCANSQIQSDAYDVKAADTVLPRVKMWTGQVPSLSVFNMQGDRPSRTHKHATLFRPDMKRPLVVWVACERRPDLDTHRLWEYAHVSSFLGNDRSYIGRKMALYNLRLDVWLSNTLEVVCCDRFLKDGSKPTRSIYEAVGASSTVPVPYCWKGPVIAFKKRGPDLDPPFYDDITLEDYRHALDYFSKYNSSGIKGSIPSRTGYNTILGVKISYYGEQKLHGAEQLIPKSQTPYWHLLRRYHPFPSLSIYQLQQGNCQTSP